MTVSNHSYTARPMDKHPDCEDCCQLREHKGYRDCAYTTGECAWLPHPAAPSATDSTPREKA